MTEDNRNLPALRAPQVPTAFRLLPSTLGEAMEMAKLIAGSELCPKAYRGKPADCIVAYDYGRALGFSWMQSLRAVACINGQPSIYGDAITAVIYGSGECERFHESIEGEGDARTAHCVIKRKGYPDEVHKTFSVADAKVAKLWQKRGRDGQDTPWITHPDRMLQWRATGFAARGAFPDKMSGLILVEEAMDYPDAINVDVVSSEIVSPALAVFDRLDEPVRDNIEKAFATLSLPAGLRMQKLTEFLGAPDVDVELGVKGLIEWCRDEYSKRKTGISRANKPDNSTKKKPEAGDGAGQSKAADAGVQAVAGVGTPAGAAVVGTSSAAADPKADTKTETADLKSSLGF